MSRPAPGRREVAAHYEAKCLPCHPGDGLKVCRRLRRFDLADSARALAAW
ncbi:MAG: hypothetical protein U0790_17170 [Isosphaeraceae bacterium]